MSNSTDTSSDLENINPRRRRSLRCKKAITGNKKASDVYDADSEPSSAYDSSPGAHLSSSKKPSRPRIDVSRSCVDEYIFSEGEESVGFIKKKTKRKRTREKILKESNHSDTESPSFKAPRMMCQPTPWLSSNLKKGNTSLNSASSAQLRVSFSDESFSDIQRFRRSYKESPRFNKQTVGINTSTPSAAKPFPPHDKKLSMTPKVSLLRLSDIASPILVHQETHIKEHLRSSHTPESGSPMSSGYGSLVKSLTDTRHDVSGNKEKHASHEMSVSSPAPTFKSAKSIKLQRKQAMQRLKDREEKYLAEIEELKDFDLIIQ